MFEGMFAPMHIIVVMVIVLLVFGPQKIPELGKGMGEALRSFKKALDEEPDAPAQPKKDHEEK